MVVIFISNIFEGLFSIVGMKNSGYLKMKMILFWVVVFVILIFVLWLGYFFFDGVFEEVMLVIVVFVGGGIIVMIVLMMMFEVYEDSGLMIGLIVVFGLLIFLVLN